MILALLALMAEPREMQPRETLPRETLGVWDRWGAFRETAPRRCYAISAPVRAGATAARAPFASVAARVGSPPRAAFFARLSTARGAAPATLAIGERRFTLAGSGAGEGTGVRAPDAETDLAIVAAMRGSRSMSIEAVSARGTPFADSYALPGAATAIDAAALACAPGG